jgi:hypothetical protein
VFVGAYDKLARVRTVLVMHHNFNALEFNRPNWVVFRPNWVVFHCSTLANWVVFHCSLN